jgi:diguanylate cyclase (GGDEF)-like protein
MNRLLRSSKTKSRILIVDDDRTTVILLSNIFKKEYEVFSTTKGAEAFSMAVEVMPDLILLDVIMPDLDGYKVGIKLKADPQTKDIPLIFITSLDDIQSETLGLKIGAIDYIHKPINPMIANLRVRNHLELERQRNLLSKMSYLDGLTTSYNRRWFDQVFPSVWKSCATDHKPLSLFILDIDWFKAYNDCYGHLAGDDALKLVVEIINSVLKRPSDMCARYGGEEFAGILFHVDFAGGEIVAEKIRSAVERANIPHEKSPNGILTVSLGVGTAFPGIDKTPKELVVLADKLLYKAKQEGRNRVCSELLSIERT